MKYTYRKPTAQELFLGIVFTIGVIIVALSANVMTALGILLIVTARTHSFGKISIKTEEKK